MAEKIDIEVALKSELSRGHQDLKTLQDNKAFEGKTGAKTLKSIQNLLAQLESVDVSKLKGKDLTEFLNNLGKLRGYLNSAASSLTTYSEAVKKQQKIVQEARRNLDQARTKKSSALESKDAAAGRLKLDKNTFFSKDTGRQVTNIDTIAELFNKGQLDIRSKTGKTSVKDQAAKAKELGITDYAKASVEVDQAQLEVKNASVTLKTEQSTLDALPKEGTVSPAAQGVYDSSAASLQNIDKIRDQRDAETSENTRKKNEELEKNIELVKKQEGTLGKAFKQFTLYAVAVRAAKQALREAVQTIRELDKYLTEQAMVTGKSREETYALVGQYQELALACGATTKEIAQVTTEYMKQGKSTADALVLTEAAVKAAKVARVSVGDSVNYLTTALNGFRLEAEDAMRVSDIFAAVAASSATDYDELAIALSKVASQANLAGMSIEYTTALLTKGLETTREAPETMGTALKTIIARMREMSDYGETLEGDTDINNVESQLAYVGIALKNEQGELRSTEEVLDELGKKWDQLNKNQQAAIAKALAGTRQQSRLIAMMDGYERVIELQQIAERSTGATSAQAAVYLEGMEAAMNKIQVAWEKIIMTITDSKIIIGILEGVGNLLDWIGELLSEDGGMALFLTVVISLGAAILLQKIAEYETQKAINRAALEEQKTKIRSTRLEKEQLLTAKKRALEIIRQAKSQAELNKFIARAAKLDKDKSNDAAAAQELATLSKEQLSLTQQEAKLTAEIKQTEAEIGLLNMQEAQTSMMIAQNGAGFASAIGNALSLLTPLLSIMTIILTIQQAINAAKAKGIGLTKKEQAAETKGLVPKVSGMFAKVVQAFSSGGIPGVIAGIALATALAVGLGVAIAASVGAFNNKSGADKTAEEVNKLSNEIYTLNQRANAIANVTSQFDKLDNKVIKTKEDIAEMNSLLKSAADSLSTDGDDPFNKDAYNALGSDNERRDFLERAERYARAQANKKRQEQLQRINKLSYSERSKLLNDNTTNSDYLQTQSAIRAIANNTVYETIDALKEEGRYTEEQLANTEDLTTALIAQLDAVNALNYANNPEELKELVNILNSLKNEENEFIVSAFMDDSTSFSDRLKAYEQIEEALNGDAAALEAFKKAYSEWETFSNMSDDIIEFIEATHLSIDQINKLYEGYTALQKAGMEITKEEFHAALEDTMTLMENDLSNFNQVVESTYGYLLEGLDPFKKEYQDKWNAIVSAIGDVFAVGLLDMGQNMEKFGNTINSFYEKASQWGSMSESDKMAFISDNATMFSGAGGKELLQAFQSGNYDAIEAALKMQMEEQTAQRLEEVRRTLAVEEARVGEDRNEAYIQSLKDYEKYLMDGNDLYKASLELRLEQEKKQIDEYKSYLEDQQKALEDSLNKRKDAYEKYFEKINQDSEYEDYKDKADLLTTNISKLASSSNADAKNKTADLEQQLKELEKERLETLRERAQEAVIQNIDDQVEEINDKFDKLLNSNEALLAAMTGELNNPDEFLANLLSNKLDSGATTLEMQSYLEELKAIYGSTLGTDVFDNIKVTENNGQTVLNINNQEVLLSEGEQQSVYAAIIAALRQIGKA